MKAKTKRTIGYGILGSMALGFLAPLLISIGWIVFPMLAGAVVVAGVAIFAINLTCAQDEN